MRIVISGFLLTFFSSFGQTFLISLYVPGIMKDFGISNSFFGSIYGAATVLSAFALIYAGNLIDTWPLKRYTAASVLILASASVVTGSAFSIILIFFGIWGLRFAGQGLLSHISNTSVSRYFTAARGKALSVSSLGYSAGEGFLPVITGIIIASFGWRISMFFNAAFLILILLPVIILVLGSREFRGSADEEESPGEANPDEKSPGVAGKAEIRGKPGAAINNPPKFSRKLLFADKRFYIIASNSFLQPFIVTGLFFYQLALASDKGWPVELITSSFILYAAGRAVFSLAGGPLVDRFTAVRMLPWYLFPFAAALTALLFFRHPFTAPFYLILTGISIGISSTVKTAVLAEVFGTKNIGSVRSVFAMISVLSTAASPALFGFILDAGFPFNTIILLSLIITGISIIISFNLSGMAGIKTGKNHKNRVCK
ncbi:MAG: MFS transporter [Spirochaetia bacterium]|nr:MFS transporter [Spirochaetia bacterium]